MKLFDNSLPLKHKSSSITSIEDILTQSYGLEVRNNNLYYADMLIMPISRMMSKYKDNFSDAHRGFFRLIFAEKFESQFATTFKFDDYAKVDDAKSIKELYEKLGGIK